MKFLDCGRNKHPNRNAVTSTTKLLNGIISSRVALTYCKILVVELVRADLAFEPNYSHYERLVALRWLVVGRGHVAVYPPRPQHYTGLGVGKDNVYRCRNHYRNDMIGSGVQKARVCEYFVPPIYSGEHKDITLYQQDDAYFKEWAKEKIRAALASQKAVKEELGTTEAKEERKKSS